MKRKNNSLVYVRCRFCGQVFNGKSDYVMEKYSKHFAECKKKQSAKKQGKTVACFKS
jgi:hypothetical protein